MSEIETLVPDRLMRIIEDLESSPIVRNFIHSRDKLPVLDQLLQAKEYVRCDEYNIAYEVIVALLEDFSFPLSGRSAICLLEVGLFLRYKSELAEDRIFDSRHE